MALTPAEQAQLAALTAKAAEPEDAPEPVVVEPVVVVVEPEAPEAPEVESESDVVIAAAVAQTIVIDAQAEADIRRMTAEAELRESEREAEHERTAELFSEDTIPDPANVLDDVMGAVEDAIPEPDLAPRPGHWFFRPLRGK